MIIGMNLDMMMKDLTMTQIHMTNMEVNMTASTKQQNQNINKAMISMMENSNLDMIDKIIQELKE